MLFEWWPVAPVAPAAWSWTPTIHLGASAIALAPIAIVLVTARLRRVRLTARSWRLLGGATVLLLIALDWPVGLFAQVSLSGRSMQYMLISLGVAPLLLLGIPRWTARGRSLPRRILEALASAPWLGALMLAAAAWLTHGEFVVDEVERDAPGQAAIRAAWFATALLYWWPLVGPGPSESASRTSRRSGTSCCRSSSRSSPPPSGCSRRTRSTTASRGCRTRGA